MQNEPLLWRQCHIFCCVWSHSNINQSKGIKTCEWSWMNLAGWVHLCYCDRNSDINQSRDKLQTNLADWEHFSAQDKSWWKRRWFCPLKKDWMSKYNPAPLKLSCNNFLNIHHQQHWPLLQITVILISLVLWSHIFHYQLEITFQTTQWVVFIWLIKVSLSRDKTRSGFTEFETRWFQHLISAYISSTSAFDKI